MFEKVNRFEVIDHTECGQGRIIMKLDVHVEASIQDDGKTLKIFLDDRDDGSVASDIIEGLSQAIADIRAGKKEEIEKV